MREDELWSCGRCVERSTIAPVSLTSPEGYVVTTCLTDDCSRVAMLNSSDGAASFGKGTVESQIVIIVAVEFSCTPVDGQAHGTVDLPRVLELHTRQVRE